jgi:uncharacterized surface anchored protein
VDLALTVPTATLTPISKERITAESTLRKYYVSDDYVLIVSIVPQGTVVLSNTSLNYQERKAIENEVRPGGELGTSYKKAVRFFSTEQHQTVIKLDKNREITVTQENGRYVVQLPPNTNSEAKGFAVKYNQQAAFNNAEIVNEYTGKAVPIEIFKVEKDSLDHENKEFLEGAKFTITQLEETRQGEYKEKPNSTTTPKELYYQEVVETDENGKATSTDLESGYYEIVETKAPDGYILTTDKFFIKVKGGVITRIRKTENTVVTQWPDEDNNNSGVIRFTPASQGTNAAFMVGNEPGMTLPHTGGI